MHFDLSARQLSAWLLGCSPQMSEEEEEEEERTGTQFVVGTKFEMIAELLGKSN